MTSEEEPLLPLVGTGTEATTYAHPEALPFSSILRDNYATPSRQDRMVGSRRPKFAVRRVVVAVYRVRRATTEPQSGNGWGFQCLPCDHPAGSLLDSSPHRFEQCEEHAMDEHEDIRQPQAVSKTLANYLDMTTPRSRAPKRRPRRREEKGGTTRPPVDNRDLSRDEGSEWPSAQAQQEV